MKVGLSRRALAEFAEILEYLAADSPRSARNFAKAMRRVQQLLGDYPQSGQLT